jgi:choline dehydrogenase-like flavoprotein
MNFRCLDYILASGCNKLGVPYLPDREAQLTVAHAGRPPCHYCGNCTEGCDTGSFFSTPWFFLPLAEKTGNLDLRTNAYATHVLVDNERKAKGVAYIDRETRKDVEVYGKTVVLAASCVATAALMLNSNPAPGRRGSPIPAAR